MPVNLETINSFFLKNFTPNQAEIFIKKKTKKFVRSSYGNFEEKALSQIGKNLYEAFIKDYTFKQWRKDPKDLPASIFNRLPIRFNYQEDYFHNSNWQGIPENGYTEIFNNMLKHKNISIILRKKYSLLDSYDVKYLTIYTGALDKLFDFRFGKLEWRSLSFKKETINLEDYQGTSVINFPERKYNYTRIHEPRHLHLERNYSKKSTLIIEVPSCNDLLFSCNIDAIKKFVLWSEHLILFNSDILRSLLKLAGFKKIKIENYQRYNINNHLHWMIYKNPSGHIKFPFIKDKKIMNSYNKLPEDIKQNISDNQNKIIMEYLL
jgi:hypothetical protein